MVSNGIQGLGLSDDLLKHYKKEIGEMALGILDGEPYDSPIQEGILLTCMVEMLPYVDSDKSEFSDEVFEGFLRDPADEINEEERGEEPPKGESERHILLQLQQSMGQVVGQLKELQSSVKEISRRVQRHDAILNSRATDSRVMDLSFLKGDQLRSEVESFRDLITLDRTIQGTT
ncbi:hypothetical protein AURANDRAFT_72281 [Aureococcus anophagefferens]|uniref:Uncharacterized protein n=1 Tax=Aureococcus anophagefferens TaxID=44056 RepID=F0YI28_AURAN|nr:hypothetical protein AURANDRAFT_72281 [Aureococcus anophagefferens]EGB05240.1 hypothetical protein AURANDRAFT_72281 [Aureococcus anophagefferens]|eukprot:XP_009040141.1 hypothetical protein AURANDRAFT_72281 [Aureococcus anophagefferens]